MKTIIIAFALAATLLTSSDNAQPNSGTAKFDINYYWFDTCGNYLRQNILDDEVFLTGYDNVPHNPKTLHELGFNPVNCVGYPPVPIDPDLPDERLYSHP